MQRDNSIAFVELELKLHGCVKDKDKLVEDLRRLLIDKLQPDFESDVEIEITEATK